MASLMSLGVSHMSILSSLSIIWMLMGGDFHKDILYFCDIVKIAIIYCTVCMFYFPSWAHFQSETVC